MNYRLAAAIRDLEHEVCESFEDGQKPVWIIERATQRLRAENQRLALQQGEQVEDLLEARRPIIAR
jgi:hypothetical protein